MGMKEKYGQYFTPEAITTFMVSLIDKNKTAKILEPACGTGAFLDALTKAGFNNLDACEIDRTLHNPYAFVRYESFISASYTDPFDVIIGNPPYIRWKNLEEPLKNELLQNALWNQYFNRLCDYSSLFILKSVELLNDGGELIFICPEYWMHTTHAASLRNYLCEHGIFEEIYHFKEASIFEKVTSSLIVFKYRKCTKKEGVISLYHYHKRQIPSVQELLEKSCFSKVYIPQFQRDQRWILASDTIQEQIKKLENSCAVNEKSGFCRIGDVCQIGNGMVSGLDKAFKADPDTDSWTAEEQQCIIQVLKAKDLQAYSPNGGSRYILLPDNLSKETFEKKYPHIKAHLEPYIDQLDRRYRYNRDIPYWEFVFLRNKSLFDKDEDKIFIPCKERISHKKYFRFCYAEKNVYPLQDVTAIYRTVRCKESIYYLLAYLNSEKIYDWLIYNGIIKGDIVEFSAAPLASIPYRRIDWKNENEVKAHSVISQNIQHYLQTHQPDYLTFATAELNRLLQ